MSLAPIAKAAIALALFRGERRVHFVVTAIAHFERLDDACRSASAVEDDPALVRLRGVWLVFGATGRRLHAFKHKAKQFVRQLGTVAKCERTKPFIFFR